MLIAYLVIALLLFAFHFVFDYGPSVNDPLATAVIGLIWPFWVGALVFLLVRDRGRVLIIRD